ncbi:hypothetical protein GC163_04705 [bacterium]|nr:hypothetical protein [bacterium]
MKSGCRAARLASVCVLSLPLSSAWAQAPEVGVPPQRLPITQVSDAQPIADVQTAKDPLIEQIDEAIRLNGQRYLTANYHSPWQIFHGILAYHQDFQLKLGEQKVSAIEWVATANPRFDGQPLFLKTQHGAKFHPFTRPMAFEGHPAQTLALLSESHLPVDYKFKTDQGEVTIGDLLNGTMMEVNTGGEVTWVLWALINYLKVDAQWTNQWGQAWSMETLVQHEVRMNTPYGPCGGNHNLFALTRARDKYIASGRTLRGPWLEADQKVKQYVEYARRMQNSDGSFSKEFYKGPGYTQDMNQRFNTTGHTMEFLSVALPQERLQEQWVRNAVHVLSSELITHRKASVDCGPLYHSLNALRIYRDRVQPPKTMTAVITPETPATTLPPAPTSPAPMTPAPVVTAPETTPLPIPVPLLQPGLPAPSAKDAVTATPAETPKPTTERIVAKPIGMAPTTPAPAMVIEPFPLAPKSAAVAAPAPTASNIDPSAPRLPQPNPSAPVVQPANDRGPISALETINR